MPMSLDDILSAPVSRERQIVPDVCLDQKRAELQKLTEERARLMAGVGGDEDEPAGPPRKSGVGVPSRVAEIDAEAASIREAMQDQTGDLVVEAPDAGVWQRWKDEHPPREDNVTDDQAAYGLCDASALIANLPTYVVEWRGESIPEDKRSAFVQRMAYSDQIATASTVVLMMETRIRPKAATTSLPTGSDETD